MPTDAGECGMCHNYGTFATYKPAVTVQGIKCFECNRCHAFRPVDVREFRGHGYSYGQPIIHDGRPVV